MSDTDEIPDLNSSGGEEDCDCPSYYWIKPAENNREAAKLWSRLSTMERERHEWVIKMNTLGPFLFGTHEPSILTEEWIQLAYENRLLTSDIILFSNVDKMTKEQYVSVELIEMACNQIMKDMVRTSALGDILDLVETLNKKKANFKNEIFDKAKNNAFVQKWRKRLKEAMTKKGNTLLDNKIALAVMYVCRQYGFHVLELTKNLRNLKEELQDSSGDSPKMIKLKEEGNEQFKQKAYRNAISQYTKAISYSQYNHLLYGNRAQAYLKLGQYDHALIDGYRSIVLKPDWPKGHYRFAEALVELHRHDEAIAANTKGRRLCPKDRDLEAQWERLCDAAARRAKNRGIGRPQKLQADELKNAVAAKLNTASTTDTTKSKSTDADTNAKAKAANADTNIKTNCPAAGTTSVTKPEPTILDPKAANSKSTATDATKSHFKFISAKPGSENQGFKFGLQLVTDQKGQENTDPTNKESRMDPKPKKSSKGIKNNKAREGSVDSRTSVDKTVNLAPKNVPQNIKDTAKKRKNSPSCKNSNQHSLSHNRNAAVSSNNNSAKSGSNKKKVEDDGSESDDVPPLVSDDNDSDNSQSDVEPDEERKVDEVISRWMNGLKSKKETISHKPKAAPQPVLIPQPHLTPEQLEKAWIIQEFETLLREGSENLLSSHYSPAVENYTKAMEYVKKHTSGYLIRSNSTQLHAVIRYSLGTAYTHKGTDSDICEGIKIFQDILAELNAKFPLAYLGLSRAFLKQNRFHDALRPAQQGLKAVSKHKYGGEFFWPQTQVVIEETRPGRLKVELQLLSRTSKCPPRPDAVCRYVDCSGHYKIYIYYDDPDFKGYVQVRCYAKCVIEFHPDCWKKYKSSSVEKQSDKDIANGPCFTPDCQSPVRNVIFYNENNEIFREIKNEAQAAQNANDMPRKKVLKTPASSVKALQRKAERRALRQRRKQEKMEQLQREKEEEWLMQQIDKMDTKAADGGATAGVKSDVTPAESPKLPSIKNVTVLKKDDSSPDYMFKGKAGQKAKKSKHRDKTKKVMTLGQFTGTQEGEEEVDLEPTCVAPTSRMGLDDFGDIPEYQMKFSLLDPSKPFSIPADLEDEIASFEGSSSQSNSSSKLSEVATVHTNGSSYTRGITNIPVSQVIHGDSLMSHAARVNASSPVSTSSSVSNSNLSECSSSKRDSSTPSTSASNEQMENIEDIKETIYNVFATLLEETGPLHVYDPRILEEMDNFPKPALKVIHTAGGIGRFLIQSLKFAMIDEFVCLMFDAVKARDLSDDYKQAVKDGKAPLKAKEKKRPPGFSDQDFPSISSSKTSRKLSLSESVKKGNEFVSQSEPGSQTKTESVPRSGSLSSVSSPLSFSVHENEPALTASVSEFMCQASRFTPSPLNTNAPAMNALSGITPLPVSSPEPSLMAPSPPVVTRVPVFPSIHSTSGCDDLWNSVSSVNLGLSSSYVPNIPTDDFPTHVTPPRPSPGVIGSGTPNRSHSGTPRNTGTPNNAGAPSHKRDTSPAGSRMFDLWQQGGGDGLWRGNTPPKLGGNLPTRLDDEPRSSMLDDVDDDIPPPRSNTSIWGSSINHSGHSQMGHSQMGQSQMGHSQSNNNPEGQNKMTNSQADQNKMTNSQVSLNQIGFTHMGFTNENSYEMKRPPGFDFVNNNSSWDLPTPHLFDNVQTEADALVNKCEQELMKEIMQSVQQQLKSSKFANSPDLEANIKASIMQDLVKGQELRANMTAESCEVGVNTEEDGVAVQYAEACKRLESQVRDHQSTREQLHAASQRNGLYRDEINTLHQRNLQLDKDSRESTAQLLISQEQWKSEKLRMDAQLAELQQKYAQTTSSLKKTESDNLELRVHIEHLTERYKETEGKLAALIQKNKLLEERAIAAEVEQIRLKTEIGIQGLDKSQKEAELYYEGFKQALANYQKDNVGIPHKLLHGLETWQNVITTIVRLKTETKAVVEEQIQKVRDGTPFAGLHNLPVVKSPPTPDINIARAILMQYNVRPGNNSPPLVPSHPPGFGMRPSTPPGHSADALSGFGNLPTETGNMLAPLKIPQVQTREASMLDVTSPHEQEVKISNLPRTPPGLVVRNTASPVNLPKPQLPPHMTGAAVGPSWSTVITKKTQSKGSSFSKIVTMLASVFPHIARDQLYSYIQDVRSQRGGSLSGLTMSEVINLTSEHILRKAPKSPEMQRPERNSLAAGLSSFSNIAAGGATVTRGEIYREDDDPCPICHDDLTIGKVSPLECGHRFHDDCIRKWFQEQSTCPTCRVHALLPDDFPRLG